MNEYKPSPEFEEKVRKAVFVPSARPEFINQLRNELARSPVKMKPRFILRPAWMMTLRTRPLMAIVLALLTLLALTSVAYAIGKSLGYIPGIGLVNQDVPIRVLAEPVTTSHNGIIFTIMQIVADSERTTVFYSINAPQPTPGPLLQPIPGEPTCKFSPVNFYQTSFPILFVCLTVKF